MPIRRGKPLVNALRRASLGPALSAAWRAPPNAALQGYPDTLGTGPQPHHHGAGRGKPLCGRPAAPGASSAMAGVWDSWWWDGRRCIAVEGVVWGVVWGVLGLLLWLIDHQTVQHGVKVVHALAFDHAWEEV